MKDRFDEELRAIMLEETEKIYLSDELKESILENCKPGLIYRIRAFLNSYIEIPVPVLIGVFAIVLMVNLIPAMDIDVDFNNRQVVEIGNSQVIVRDMGDVDGYED